MLRDSDAISFPGFTSTVDYFKRRKGWSARTEGWEKGGWGEREEARTWQEKAATYFREKQNAGMGPTSGTVASWKKRVKNGRRERERERRRRKREDTSSGGEPGYNAGNAGSASRCLTTKKDPRAIYYGRRTENLCEDSHWQVVLLAMKNRNFSLTLSIPLPSMFLPCLNFSLCFYMRLGWIARNWRNKRDVLLNAINIKCATRTFDFSASLE